MSYNMSGSDERKGIAGVSPRLEGTHGIQPATRYPKAPTHPISLASEGICDAPSTGTFQQPFL
jgi:hypothetical protein